MRKQSRSLGIDDVIVVQCSLVVTRLQCLLMALFGKESSKDVARADAFKAWITARPGEAIISMGAGAMAMLDAFTVVIGVFAGIAAIIMGRRGLKRIEQSPELLGKRLCKTGMVLGSLGIATSLVLYFVVYPSLAS